MLLILCYNDSESRHKEGIHRGKASGRTVSWISKCVFLRNASKATEGKLEEKNRGRGGERPTKGKKILATSGVGFETSLLQYEYQCSHTHEFP